MTAVELLPQWVRDAIPRDDKPHRVTYDGSRWFIDGHEVMDMVSGLTLIACPLADDEVAALAKSAGF